MGTEYCNDTWKQTSKQKLVRTKHVTSKAGIVPKIQGHSIANLIVTHVWTAYTSDNADDNDKTTVLCNRLTDRYRQKLISNWTQIRLLNKTATVTETRAVCCTPQQIGWQLTWGTPRSLSRWRPGSTHTHNTEQSGVTGGRKEHVLWVVALNHKSSSTRTFTIMLKTTLPCLERQVQAKPSWVTP
jgi:hypothetical protein